MTKDNFLPSLKKAILDDGGAFAPDQLLCRTPVLTERCDIVGLKKQFGINFYQERGQVIQATVVQDGTGEDFDVDTLAAASICRSLISAARPKASKARLDRTFDRKLREAITLKTSVMQNFSGLDIELEHYFGGFFQCFIRPAE